MTRKARHSGRPILLAVFAHPDDESFLAGGTLAKYAHLGWDVFLLCATYGESGQRGEFEALTANEFAGQRRSELQAACRALGIHPPLFLECIDRAVAAICWNSAAKEMVRIIRRLQPDVVITFGPDGISGHPDHVALSQIVTSAFWAATVHTFPWRKAVKVGHASLYYVLRSTSVPQCCGQNGTVPAPRLTTVIDIAGFGERKVRAVHCHRSQRHLLPTDSATTQIILSAPEHFHRAFPRWEGTTIENRLGEPHTYVGELSANEVEHETLRR